LIREQSRVELAVVNPSFVLGPPFSTRTDSTSIAVVKRLIEGGFAVRFRCHNHRSIRETNNVCVCVCACALVSSRSTSCE